LSHCCFWDLSLAFLQALAKHLGCEIQDDTSDILHVVMTLMKHVLPGSSEGDLLSMCRHRTAAMKRTSCKDGVEDLLRFEEAGAFLDEDDIKTLKKEDGKARDQKVQFDDYRKSVMNRSSRSGCSPASRLGGVSASRSSSASSSVAVPKEGLIPHESEGINTTWLVCVAHQEHGPLGRSIAAKR
jgi:hypothetical protein